jgi:hypothetical protein
VADVVNASKQGFYALFLLFFMLLGPNVFMHFLVLIWCVFLPANRSGEHNPMLWWIRCGDAFCAHGAPCRGSRHSEDLSVRGDGGGTGSLLVAGGNRSSSGEHAASILYTDVCMLLHVNFYVSCVMDGVSWRWVWRWMWLEFLCFMCTSFYAPCLMFFFLAGGAVARCIYASCVSRIFIQISMHYCSTILYIIGAH